MVQPTPSCCARCFALPGKLPPPPAEMPLTAGKRSGTTRRRVVERVAARTANLLGAESMVDPNVEAVVVLRLRWTVGVVVDGRASLREWHQLENVGRGRIDPVPRNHVAGEPLPGQRIVDIGHAREVPGPHRGGRDGAGEGLSLGDPQARVVAEEERAVGLDGAAEAAAELLQVVGRLVAAASEVVCASSASLR